MNETIKSLADLKKFDPNAEAAAKGGRAPMSKGEVEQRKANAASHSQRVHHGGRPASGSKA